MIGFFALVWPSLVVGFWVMVLTSSGIAPSVDPRGLSAGIRRVSSPHRKGRRIPGQGGHGTRRSGYVEIFAVHREMGGGVGVDQLLFGAFAEFGLHDLAQRRVHLRRGVVEIDILAVIADDRHRACIAAAAIAMQAWRPVFTPVPRCRGGSVRRARPPPRSTR